MFRKILRILLTTPLALVLLFEEWGWAPLAALMMRLARLPIWYRLERWIASLPPWAALVTFLLPMIALFPVKLGAIYLFAAGHKLSGAILLIAAKLAGTAVVARLFHITQPALMQSRGLPSGTHAGRPGKTPCWSAFVSHPPGERANGASCVSSGERMTPWC